MQKFHYGDLVQVAKDLGPSMAHFTSDCRAIVIASYHDKYGGSCTDHQYTLFLEGRGESSWYYEEQLTLLSPCSADTLALLSAWRDQEEAAVRQHQDLRWIGAHWNELVQATSSTTILKILDELNIDTAFHRNGEYYCLLETWYNLLPTLNAIMRCTSEEELNGLANEKTPPDIHQRTLAFWRATHVND